MCHSSRSVERWWSFFDSNGQMRILSHTEELFHDESGSRLLRPSLSLVRNQHAWSLLWMKQKSKWLGLEEDVAKWELLAGLGWEKEWALELGDAWAVVWE